MRLKFRTTGISLVPGSSRRTSTPLFAASTMAAYRGGGATRYASVIHRRSWAAAASICTARYARDCAGTPSITRSAEEPHGSDAAATASGGRGAPVVAHTRANEPSSTATAGPHTASIVSRHGIRPCSGPPADDDELAVVAAEQLEGAAPQQGPEGSDLGTRAPQLATESPPGPYAAERIVQHPHPHPGPGPLRERGAEAVPGAVAADDVVLEMNGATRARDQREHRVERSRAVGKMPHGVAGDQARGAGAVERAREAVGHPPRPSAASTGRSA